jgi:Uma2 family endonuclease
MEKVIRGKDLIDMPFDGMDRSILRGHLREYAIGALDSRTGKLLPVMGRFHSKTLSNVSGLLADWLRTQVIPRGEVLSGGAGIQLQKSPETTFGVDVMYVSAEVLAAQTGESTIIEGIPTLAVEILSPSETLERVDEKTDAYLAAGVPLVWLLDLHDKSVTVYRPGAEPETYNRLAELTAEPHLPGFRVKVADLFE